MRLRLEQLVVQVAIDWWRTKRRHYMKASDHARNPTVNCTTPEEIALAIAVGRYVEHVRKRTKLEEQERRRGAPLLDTNHEF